jgi:hypothetical protein
VKDIFGRSKGPSKEDIEREAQREVERLTRNAGRPPVSSGGGGLGQFGTPGGGLPTELDRVADSVRGRAPGGARQRPAGGPGPGLGSQFRGRSGPSGAPPPTLDSPDFYDDEDDDDEGASVTNIALRDEAARLGADPNDLVIRQDPVTAEEMRDRAMRQFFEQQEARRRPQSAPQPSGSPGGVLARLEARRRAEDQERAQQGAEGGVLARLRRREEGEDDEEEEAPRPGRPARAEGPGGRRGAAQTSPRVFAMPAADEEDEEDEDDSPLDAIASRLSRAPAPRRRGALGGDSGGPSARPTGRARPSTGRKAATSAASSRRSSSLDGGSKESGARAASKARSAGKSAAKRSATKTSATKRSVAKGSVARKAAAKRALAKKSTANRAPAKKSIAKRSVAKKSVAKRTPAKKTGASTSTAKRSVAGAKGASTRARAGSKRTARRG